jgi:hypothetical protein
MASRPCVSFALVTLLIMDLFTLPHHHHDAEIKGFIDQT